MRMDAEHIHLEQKTRRVAGSMCDKRPRPIPLCLEGGTRVRDEGGLSGLKAFIDDLLHLVLVLN